MFPCAAASGGVQPAWPWATGMAVGTIAVTADDYTQNHVSLQSDRLCEVIWDSGWLHPCIFPFAFCSEYFSRGGKDKLTLSRCKRSAYLPVLNPNGSFLCCAMGLEHWHGVNVFRAKKRIRNGPSLGEVLILH